MSDQADFGRWEAVDACASAIVETVRAQARMHGRDPQLNFISAAAIYRAIELLAIDDPDLPLVVGTMLAKARGEV